MNTVTLPYRGGIAGGDDTRAAIERADAEVRANWGEPAYMRRLLTAMTETIYQGFQHENLVQFFSQVETADEGERITLEEVRGLEVFWVSLGSAINQSRITERVWELKQDYVAFHTSELIKKMRNGFSRPASQMQALAIQQLDAEISARLFRTWQAAIPDASSPYYVSGSGVALSEVRTAITEVRDESRTDQITIVGRGTMIDKVYDGIEDDNLFVPETQEALINLGVIGKYRGATLVTLTNFRDLNDVSFFPANEMWVLARDASKVGFWGTLTTQEWEEQGGWYWHLLGLREAGFAVHHPERARRIVDNDQDP